MIALTVEWMVEWMVEFQILPYRALFVAFPVEVSIEISI